MTEEQEEQLALARESLEATRLLHGAGHFGFAAPRAYYAMFYVAQAFLLGKGLAFSKHSAVIAAFGRHFAKTGIVPRDLHHQLIDAAEVRHAGDYSAPKSVTPAKSEEQIERATRFLEFGEELL